MNSSIFFEKKQKTFVPVKIYKWFFIIFTLAQMLFTVTWFLFVKKVDRVIVLSSLIYLGGIFIAFITFEIEKYRKRKKELIDNLP